MSHHGQGSSPKFVRGRSCPAVDFQFPPSPPPNHPKPNRPRFICPSSFGSPSSAPCWVKSRKARVRKDRSRAKTATDSRRVVFPRPLAPVSKTRLPRFSRSRDGWQRNEVRRRRRSTPRGLGRPHRHDHVKKRFVVADHARAQFVNKVKVHRVAVDVLEGVDQKLRIESHGKILPLVLHR